jgi:hypothetical protein
MLMEISINTHLIKNNSIEFSVYIWSPYHASPGTVIGLL